MRLLLFLMVVGLLLSGCARQKPARPPGTSPVPPSRAAGTNSSLIVTPGTQLTGRIATVNPVARFVVTTFPLGTMPSVNQRMNVYRNGLKVAEIKITGPQRDVNIVGDIINGECQPGDEVKTQ